jgi:hypothetical protein
MLLIGTERTHVAWTIMYEAVSDHLVLALEAWQIYELAILCICNHTKCNVVTFTTFAPRTIFHRTVMVPYLAVNILM